MDPGRIRQRARRPAGDLRPVEALFKRLLIQVGQRVPVNPIAVARLITEATAPGLMPRLRAVSRWLRFRVHFSRRISRMFRMGSRSVAIALLGTDVAKDAMVEPDAQRRPPDDRDALESVITTRGTGDHDALE